MLRRCPQWHRGLLAVKLPRRFDPGGIADVLPWTDTLLLTVPNQLGVAYNAHAIEAILTHVAPALGWR